MNRNLTADYIFDGFQFLENHVLIVAEDGEILNLQPRTQSKENVEFFEGVLCPGFINSHCHLELSHLKGKVTPGGGLPNFIKELVPQRLASGAEIDAAIVNAEAEMMANGIVAVGDICNTEATFPRKAVSQILYHSFMEVFSPDPSKAKETLDLGKTLERRMKQIYPEANVSITPHAPYSVSNALFNLIANLPKGNLISIHNQETDSEDAFFEFGKGEMFELMNRFSNGLEVFLPNGLRSLPTTISKLPRHEKLMFVHNTFTNSKDIEFALQNNSDIWFCLCPKANLFIENKLPDLNKLGPLMSKIVLGTDSLASNDSLDLLSEMNLLKEYFPNISTAEMLKWATSNAAKYFNWTYLGVFAKGNYPGVNHISGLNGMEITSSSKLNVLI